MFPEHSARERGGEREGGWRTMAVERGSRDTVKKAGGRQQRKMVAAFKNFQHLQQLT